jgi:hypothetical protein
MLRRVFSLLKTKAPTEENYLTSGQDQDRSSAILIALTPRSGDGAGKFVKNFANSGIHG